VIPPITGNGVRTVFHSSRSPALAHAKLNRLRPTQLPFVEFLWADFFRPHVAAKIIKNDPRRATREGLRLAQSKQALYLPGWSGKASV
jgi:hypothetical protein